MRRYRDFKLTYPPDSMGYAPYCDKDASEWLDNPAFRAGRAAFGISCSRCDVSTMTAFPVSIPPEIVIKRWRSIGWRVGSKPSRDICPVCMSTSKRSQNHNQTVATELSNVTKISPTAPVAEPPRAMSRDDRRIIFEKLNDAYVNEATGYDAGWSDKRVAADLGVPRAWVEQIREEMFGPARNEVPVEILNQQISALSIEVEAVKETMREANQNLANLLSRQHELIQQGRDLKRLVS